MHNSPYPSPPSTSFGVLALELLTNRHAVFMLEGGQQVNIKEWTAKKLASSRIADICDPRIAAPDALVRCLAELAISCTTMPTASRPTMGKVASELEALKDEFVGHEVNRAARNIDEQIHSASQLHRPLDEELDRISNMTPSSGPGSTMREEGSGIVPVSGSTHEEESLCVNVSHAAGLVAESALSGAVVLTGGLVTGQQKLLTAKPAP
ncbi:unnamed protein product [Closterium sp. Naga37s-1]|nr:unnamed protein product [Closterium sp. Naga37s-1]